MSGDPAEGLVQALTRLGDEYGPRGVAEAAAAIVAPFSEAEQAEQDLHRDRLLRACGQMPYGGSIFEWPTDGTARRRLVVNMEAIADNLERLVEELKATAEREARRERTLCRLQGALAGFGTLLHEAQRLSPRTHEDGL